MQDASFKQQTRQKYKANHQQTGLPPHSALTIRGKKRKHSVQISPVGSLDKPLDQTSEGRNQKEEIIQP